MQQGFDRVSRDIFRVGRGQQALYALMDAFAKAILACMPEPPPEQDHRPSPARRNAMSGSSRPPVRRCRAMRGPRCRIWWTMARTDEEREFRLRPPKPRVTRNEGAAWSNGFKLLMHYARSSRKEQPRAGRKRERHASVPPALRGPSDVPEEQDPRAMEGARALPGARECRI